MAKSCYSNHTLGWCGVCDIEAKPLVGEGGGDLISKGVWGEDNGGWGGFFCLG